jgi:hypothetical protein
MCVVVFSNDLFDEINKICKDKNYSEVLTIMARKHPEGVEEEINTKIIKLNKYEAQLIADVAIVEHTQAGLIYPYWSDEHPNYNESHEEDYFEVQSFLQTVLFSLSAFDIKTQGSAN